MEGFEEIISQSVVITIFVFSMMIIVDYINILTQGRIRNILLRSRSKQYLISSFLGATPGCLGAFMSVSMYVHGIISFGALTACMIATSGDEAFVMLTLFPDKAIFTFLILFVVGIFSGIVVDFVVRKFKIKVCEECSLQEYHEEKVEKIFSKKPKFFPSRYVMLMIFSSLLILDILGIFGPEEGVERVIFLSISSFLILVSIFSSDHYLREHIINHIAREHIWKVFLWTFFALLFVNVFISMFDLADFIESNMHLILLISALVGIVPESGPHMVFVMMFFKGMIPFSVLLTSSIVQDGHGMLPLLSYTVKDSILIKLINLVIGISIGLILYSIGL